MRSYSYFLTSAAYKVHSDAASPCHDSKLIFHEGKAVWTQTLQISLFFPSSKINYQSDIEFAYECKETKFKMWLYVEVFIIQ